MVIIQPAAGENFWGYFSARRRRKIFGVLFSPPQAKIFWNGLEEISAAGEIFLKLGLEEINFLQYFLAKKLISSWLFEILKVNFLQKLISSDLVEQKLISSTKVNFLKKS